MSVILQCSAGFPLSAHEVRALWRAVVAYRNYRDEPVTVRCITEREIRELNRRYRSVDASTNVLTFSYVPSIELKRQQYEHDVALCLNVAEREASKHGKTMRDYVALLLVHAFLHAAGMDHEQSSASAREQRAAEKNILTETGFAVDALS